MKVKLWVWKNLPNKPDKDERQALCFDEGPIALIWITGNELSRLFKNKVISRRLKFINKEVELSKVIYEIVSK